ncbi:MAG: acetamidase/formamidase family protein [Ancalomicrobiaceae bacterium]|nr:acetamidase/formamidase family protein [Ancalomicrobiaceae bacterium]
MTVHEIFPGPETVHWGHLGAHLEPVIEIDPGEIVTLHSVSGGSSEVPSDPRLTVRPELRAIHRTLAPRPGPHILTGPVYVRGARPGDILRVEILDIALRDDWGFNIMKPGKGALPDDFSEPQLLHLAIDREKLRIRTPWGLDIAARPFFGVMAAAPRAADGSITSVIPGYFGGNIDNKELVAGSVLYLPVSIEGALFSAGDGHASQGDGEVCLTAVETGLTGSFRLDVLSGEALDGPYAETPTHLIAMGFDESLEEAMRAALRAAIRMIVRRSGLTEAEAYSLCSMAADVRITQVVNVKQGAHVMIPKYLLNANRQQEEAIR